MRYRLILTAILFFGGLMATSTAHAQGAGCGAVKREMAYGEAAIQDAKSRADYLDAAKQYRAAIKKAPSCAAAHFNLGVAYEKAGRLSSAKAAYERYLKLAPNAKDAAKVEKSIFKLEYRIKKAGRTRRAGKTRKAKPRKTAKARRTASANLNDLAGYWLMNGVEFYFRAQGNVLDIICWSAHCQRLYRSMSAARPYYRFSGAGKSLKGKAFVETGRCPNLALPSKAVIDGGRRRMVVTNPRGHTHNGPPGGPCWMIKPPTHYRNDIYTKK